ncbi:MAG: cellulase family glycosylhydrolase [Sphingobacteriales bacterium]
MKKKYLFKTSLFLITILFFLSCKKNTNNSTEQQPAAQLAVNVPSVNFTADGGSQDVTVTSNSSWTLNNVGAAWMQASPSSGKSGNTVIHLTVTSQNATGAALSGFLYINSSGGKTVKLIATQVSTLYPTYNTSPKAPDASGMGSTATQLAANVTMGWNIFNTLEAWSGETSWGNPVVNQGLIDLVKSTGFNAIRIPIQYDGHLINAATAQIDPTWLARVKAVVQYCFNDNMYVIVNIHYDFNCKVVGAAQDSVNARHKAYWEQIATALRDFDEHLMFASANEPDANNIPAANTLMRYHQTFINAVRSTGGRNTYRTLVIQAPNTSIDLLINYLDPANPSVQLPTDPTPNKMMLEFHYYTPSQFCILGGYGSTQPYDAGWGKELYFWGRDFHTTNPKFLDRNCDPSTEEGYVASVMNSVKQKFVNKGIPLVMGEFDNQYHAQRLTGYPADSLLALRSGDHYYAYIVKQAKANGVLPFLWASGIFNRSNNTIGNHTSLDSVKKGAGL